MDWAGIGKSIAKTAPILGAVLGGPVGAIAAAGGAILGSVLGVEPDPNAVQSTLAANPEAYAKVREAELQYQGKLIDLQAEQVRAELANVQGAREREVELAKTGHGASWGTTIVALIVTVGFFAMLYIVLTSDEGAIGDAGLMLLGTLATSFGAVVNYYLGSSLGSAIKERKLHGGK